MTDILTRFEELLQQPPRDFYVLRLYVIGASERSARAVSNLTRICEEHFPGRYELTVIDLLQSPEQAPAAGVVAAPTLVKELPLPVRRLIGDLSNTERVLLALEHQAPPEASV